LNPRDLHRLVDAVAEIDPLPSDEPIPVEMLDLFGVLAHETHGDASDLDRMAEALSSVGATGAEPSLLVVGRGGRIRFAQGAGRRLLASYFREDKPTRLPKVIREWAVDRPEAGEMVIDGPDAQLVVSVPTREASQQLVVMLYERPRQHPRGQRLTPREREVLELVDEGRTNAEIAQLLWVAPGTIRKHLENAYAKLGVRSRTEATALLRREAAQANC
jgi:DNA-binding CsgD family transcriptional regulator